MGSKLMRLALLLAIGVAMLPFSGLAEQTPPAELKGECGPNIGLLNSIPKPTEVTYVYACGIVVNLNVTISTTMSIKANATLQNNEGTDIRQTGSSSITGISGVLTITLVRSCSSSQTCTTTTGTAQLGTVGADNSVTFSDIPVGTSVDVAPGKIVLLNDVTVTYTTGDEGALISTASSYDLHPGAGCVVACWQI